MTDSAPAVVWLRHDLRLTDNTALYAACQAHRQVKLIFTLTRDSGSSTLCPRHSRR